MELRRHNLLWTSSYDRGLEILLFMWPDIIAKYPNAELHICYGWDLFDIACRNNPERMQWKKSVDALMNQKGIRHYGRIGKKRLAGIRKDCGIWAYPTTFEEINCISALEAQNDGLVPVTMNSFALKETVGSGIKIDGDIKKIEVQKKYVDELLSLMGDHKRWKKESYRAKKFARKYYWEIIAKKWIEEFKKPINKPLVSVITVTKREGWWNVMAANLAKQTYKNFDWVIIDDYGKDRSLVANRFAQKYGLKIRYFMGDKALNTYERKHGLVRANNKGWRMAQGELLVYLQDFIRIPLNGIENLVDLYRHNPNALLAPVDEYWFPIEPNKINTIDWWDGNTDIINKFSWRNIRVKFQGIRETDNPYDFEMNYAGIPKHIIKKLNGWWEFFDDGMGFDNTEIAQRALQSGYKILIDDTNIAECIDIGHHGLKLNEEGWEKFNKGKYPLVRKEELDK